MNKILRNSLVAVFALMANLSFADTTVTFTAGTDNGKYTGTADSESGTPASGAETITKDGVTISTTDGAFAAINYNTQAGEYRIYKSKTFTASTTSGNIKKIVFTCTAKGTEKQGPGCFTGTGYTFEADGYIGTWTGSATSVTLNATSNQVRATKIEVTIGNGDSPVDPDPTPDPDPQPEVKTCANIAEFKALASGTTAILTLTNAEVVYKNEYNTNTEYYVRDASGAIQFYNTGLNLASGQLLNGTVEVKYSPYNEMPEATKSANTSEDNLEIDDADEILPTAISVEDLANSDKYLCDWVIVKNAEMLKEVTKNTDGTKTYTNYYMTSGDAKVMVYDKFKKGITIPETGAYDIQGIAVKASLSGKIVTELAPIAAPVTTGIKNITATEAAANAPIYNLAGQKVSKAFKGIVIQNGKKFVK